MILRMILALFEGTVIVIEITHYYSRFALINLPIWQYDSHYVIGILNRETETSLC